MLVEINLLPQKEAKNKTLLVLAVIVSMVILLGVGFTFWFMRGVDQQLAVFEQQIATTQTEIATEQQKLVNVEVTDSLTTLANTVEWAAVYPVKTVPVLQKLTALLPNRGFIKTFTYAETGTVSLNVQFEESREAAYYLAALVKSTWVSDAKLTSLNAVTSFYDNSMDENFDDTHVKNEKYIPRYEGTFEISLNQQVIKDDLHKKKAESASTGQKDGDDS